MRFHRLTRRRWSSPGRHPADEAGYLMVVFVVVLAFVGVAGAMQILVLTSVAATSRAYDSYRQGATERSRLEKIVTEAVLDQCQVRVPASSQSPATAPADALQAKMVVGIAAADRVVATTVPAALPVVVTFPDPTGAANALLPMTDDVAQSCSPELAWLAGPRVASYDESIFEFSTTRVVLDVEQTYHTRVAARLLAVPLTRFPIAAYELPGEIGSGQGTPAAASPGEMPRGLVPGRDAAFVPALQASPRILPYHFRRRAALAAAYQYVFSQAYIDRVAEYAGVTHFRRLDDVALAPNLAGLSQAGATATFDLAAAGQGTYGGITDDRDAVVVFTEAPGYRLGLVDSASSEAASPLLLLALGPSDTRLGPLTLQIGHVSRPLVVVGYNIRVEATPGSALNGGLLLDPASSFAPGPPLSVGHLSYWAGSSQVSAASVTPGELPRSAEHIAPRVIYVSARASRS